MAFVKIGGDYVALNNLDCSKNCLEYLNLNLTLIFKSPFKLLGVDQNENTRNENLKKYLNSLNISKENNFIKWYIYRLFQE